MRRPANTAVVLTDDVQRTARARGPAGAAWIESLPGIVAHLRDAWSLTIGEPLPGGKAGPEGVYSFTRLATTVLPGNSPNGFISS